MEVEEIERKILEFWKKHKTFEKSLEKTLGKKPYVFYDGPPFATGLPHYGHILASVLKDVFPRFFTMNGRYVKRIWGWDCHGLPIENIAEKELEINSKDEIEKMGVKKFNDFCRGKVLTYASEWKKVVERVGRWVEFDNSYKTMDNNYIESVWWAFKQLYEKGFIYEGEKVLMYCPRCSTPLAKSEITMDNSYKMIKDISLVVKFKLKNEEAYALAWTTTPWTLPSNLALTLNPDLTYSFVKDKNSKETYILAKELLSKFYKSPEEYQVVKEVKGKDLEGEEYEPLFDYFKDTKNAFKFILADFVTAEDGTGIVHTAPAFGEDDNAVCRKYKIPMVQPVDAKGRFTKEVKDFANQYIFDANLEIVKFLKENKKAVMSRKIEHEYPFCYRCDTKLMYRALPAWFVDIQKIKKKLLKLNEKINWIPKFLKEGRVKHNIETAPDWNISRNRYWASAIPVWKSEKGKIKVIGSIEELRKYSKNLPKGKIDLHKDFLDKIYLEIGGEKYTRIPEVMDCWFESGSMPFAQFHYPFENKKFFEENFPSQFVVEYIGQTRAWFYYMIALSAILFDKIPFENVLTTGTILAEDGEKMSKSKNNFPDPNKIIKKYGVDSLRFYLLQSSVMNADNFNFSEKGVEEIYKKVILLLYNVNNFYLEYKTNKELGKEKLEKIDEWILSRLEETGLNVTKNMNLYNTIKACEEIRKFVEDLSTGYVRINRDRFNDGDEIAPLVLKKVLRELSKLIAPITPFIAETIYQKIYSEKDSVHLQEWTDFNEKKIDKELIEEMNKVKEFISFGLAQRDKEKIGLKWPLKKVKIYIKENQKFEKFEELIKSQLNVKEIEFQSPTKLKKEFDLELDTTLTSELEAEGYAREMSRQIQAFRKNLGLKKKDKIELFILTDKEFKNILETQTKFIEERTNSKELKFLENVTTDKERFKNINDFKIKDKRGRIGIIY